MKQRISTYPTNILQKAIFALVVTCIPLPQALVGSQTRFAPSVNRTSYYNYSVTHVQQSFTALRNTISTYYNRYILPHKKLFTIASTATIAALLYWKFRQPTVPTPAEIPTSPTPTTTLLDQRLTQPTTAATTPINSALLIPPSTNSTLSTIPSTSTTTHSLPTAPPKQPLVPQQLASILGKASAPGEHNPFAESDSDEDSDTEKDTKTHSSTNTTSPTTRPVSQETIASIANKLVTDKPPRAPEDALIEWEQKNNCKIRKDYHHTSFNESTKFTERDPGHTWRNQPFLFRWFLGCVIQYPGKIGTVEGVVDFKGGKSSHYVAYCAKDQSFELVSVTTDCLFDHYTSPYKKQDPTPPTAPVKPKLTTEQLQQAAQERETKFQAEALAIAQEKLNITKPLVRPTSAALAQWKGQCMLPGQQFRTLLTSNHDEYRTWRGKTIKQLHWFPGIIVTTSNDHHGTIEGIVYTPNAGKNPHFLVHYLDNKKQKYCFELIDVTQADHLFAIYR